MRLAVAVSPFTSADVGAHERRAVVYDNKGNGLVFYNPLAR